MEKAYSNRELYNIAKENYQTLIFHCVKLHTEGYWTKPEKLLKQSIREQLDLYLQAFLLMFAVHSGHFEEEQRHFVRAIPDGNLLDVREEESLNDELVTQAKRVLLAPPILLQLFALRDREKKTHLSVMFMDTMLNIVIAMSYLNGQKGAGVVEFLQAYVQQIRAFLNEELAFLLEIDTRYVFRKISSSTFRTGYVRDEMEYARMLVEPDAIEKGQVQPSTGGGTDSGTFRQEKTESIQDVEVETDSRQKVEKERKLAKEPQPAMNQEEIARETAKARLELEQARDAKRAAAVQKLMDQLDELVGLENVKKEMQSLVNLIKVRKMRANYNMPQMDMTYHMVFTGNAGTGKTTVARLVAEIYKELGVLSKGTFVETDRAGLVAGYLGQTAMKVKEVVAQAKGGVLFIDEAYSLSSRDAGDDYGIEAIDTLVKEMEDNRNDLVVIVAGYRKEMEHFLKSNTGLVSRFNKFIDFPDYTEEQLVDILKMMAQKAGMTIEESALVRLHKYLEQMDEFKRKDFGNARGIRNTFEKIITNQANRLVQTENPTMKELSRILEEDILL